MFVVIENFKWNDFGDNLSEKSALAKLVFQIEMVDCIVKPKTFKSSLILNGETKIFKIKI